MGSLKNQLNQNLFKKLDVVLNLIKNNDIKCKLKSISKQVDVLKIKKINHKFIINSRNEDQRKIAIDKLESEASS